MRRSWLAVTAVFLSTVGLAVPAQARPNIVVVITDDQRHDALGVVQREQGVRGRFPFFADATPNMDRLVREGARFRDGFVVSSLCSPGRASMLTGRYPHDHGVVSNDRPFPTAAVTYATKLKAAGYRTGYFGKWHMGTQSARPGFEIVATYDGQGVYNNQVFRVKGVNRQEPGYVDDATARHAANYIRASSKLDKPFLAIVGFKAAHPGYTPPDRYLDLFSGADARPAGNERAYMPYDPSKVPSSMSAGQVQDYFAALKGADDGLGVVLAALDQTGEMGETLLIFTSDNGFPIREHGRPGRPVNGDRDGEKRANTNESIRVPLLMRGPGIKAGMAVGGPALNIDLAPTILEAAGLAGIGQGRSLWPMLRGAGSSRDFWLYEYFKEGIYYVPDLVGVHGGGWVLTEYPGHPAWTQLFRLTDDPGETRNLAGSMPEKLAEMRRRLEEQKRLTGYRQL